MKRFGNKITWFSAVIQYLVAAYLLYAATLSLQVELKVAFLGLGIAMASSASALLKELKDRNKMDEILKSIKRIEQNLESKEKITYLVEAGVAFIEYLRKIKK